MKKQILSIAFLFLLKSFQSTICMDECNSNMLHSDTHNNIQEEISHFIELPSEIKLHILALSIASIIENNSIFDPFKDVLEFIKTAILIDKKHFRSFKNDLILFAYQQVKDFFAPNERKSYSMKDKDFELSWKVRSFYPKKTRLFLRNINEIEGMNQQNLTIAKDIAKLIISGVDPNLKIDISDYQNLEFWDSQNKENILFHMTQSRDQQTWPCLIPLLIFYGFSIHSRNRNKQSLLFSAIKTWNKKMVQILIDYGINIDDSAFDLALFEENHSERAADKARLIEAKFGKRESTNQKETDEVITFKLPIDEVITCKLS